MMKFEDFIAEKEKGLIKATSYKNWYEEKVYFVSEMIEFVKEFEKIKNNEV